LLIFWHKYFGAKADREVLMKLTTEVFTVETAIHEVPTDPVTISPKTSNRHSFQKARPFYKMYKVVKWSDFLLLASEVGEIDPKGRHAASSAIKEVPAKSKSCCHAVVVNVTIGFFVCSRDAKRHGRFKQHR